MFIYENYYFREQQLSTPISQATYLVSKLNKVIFIFLLLKLSCQNYISKIYIFVYSVKFKLPSIKTGEGMPDSHSYLRNL